MAFDFPSSPLTGQSYTAGGVSYVWNGYAWTGGPVADLGLYVAKAGDKMTGDLEIEKGTPLITLDKTASGQISGMFGQLNGVNRWRMALGDGAADAANGGSDFTLRRYDDTGTFLDTPFSIDRKTGLVTSNVAMPAVLGHRNGAGDTALSTGAWTKINLGTISSAINVGGWAINASQGLTVPKTGIYLVSAQVDISTPATGSVALLAGFGVNSFTAPAANGRIYHGVSNNVQYNIGCVRNVFLTAGDALYLIAFASLAGCVAKDSSTDTYLSATLVAAQ